MNTTTSPITTLTIDSPIGAVRLDARGDALLHVHLPDRFTPAPDSARPAGVLGETARQLRAYFAGTLRAFDVPLAVDGTEFQRRVWDALATIPYGATCAYVDIARELGAPTASRAVGAANGKNPHSILVPCHRVIGTSGALTGYGGGLTAKKWLLAHEARVAGHQPSLPL